MMPGPDIMEGPETESAHDPRPYHKRSVDGLTLFNLERYDDRSFDLIIREVDYYYNEDNSPGAEDYLYGNQKGDIDFGLVDFDELLIRAFEVKPLEKYKKHGREQMHKLGETVSNFADSIGRDWTVTGNVVLSQDLDERYLEGPVFKGDYYAPPEEIERIKNSREFQELNELMFDDRLELDEESLLQEELKR